MYLEMSRALMHVNLYKTKQLSFRKFEVIRVLVAGIKALLRCEILLNAL